MNEPKNIWIGIGIAILVVGAYMVGQNSKTLPQVSVGTTQSTTTASNSPASGSANEQSAIQPSDDLFARRQACAQELPSFEQETQAEFTKWGITNSMPTNFVVGYSPSLQTCIGGYDNVSTPGGAYIGILSQYSIINLSTNQALTGLPGETLSNYIEESSSYPNQPHEYQAYLDELSQLTGGELQ